MITTTSLQHPNLRAKLHGAMIRASSESRIDQDGAGAHMVGKIQVCHLRANKQDQDTGFRFAYCDGWDFTDITATVLAALRS